MTAKGESKKEISSDRIVFCFVTAVAIILIPLTSGISILFYIVIFCCYGCVEQSERSQAREDALRQSVPDNDESSVDPSVRERDDSSVTNAKIDTRREDPEDISLDRYIFPSKCPQCLAELNLDEIEWVETNSALCPNCESLIKAEKI